MFKDEVESKANTNSICHSVRLSYCNKKASCLLACLLSSLLDIITSCLSKLLHPVVYECGITGMFNFTGKRNAANVLADW